MSLKTLEVTMEMTATVRRTAVMLILTAWELVLERRKERRKSRRVRRTSTIGFIEYID